MSLFNIKNIVKTKNYNNINTKISQEAFYRMNGSSEDLIKLVKMNNKSFGEKMQSIVIELLDLDKSNHTGHDAQCLSLNLKFEIKTSRYWVSIKDFKWQHIMLHHDYNYLILVGVDFDKLKVYIISKMDIIQLNNIGVIKMQGGAEGQGLWMQFNKIKEHLHEITNKRDFYKYLKN